MTKNCPEEGNIRCIDCICIFCDNDCTECNVEDCEPREQDISKGGVNYVSTY